MHHRDEVGQRLWWVLCTIQSVRFSCNVGRHIVRQACGVTHCLSFLQILAHFFSLEFLLHFPLQFTHAEMCLTSKIQLDTKGSPVRNLCYAVSVLPHSLYRDSCT